MSLPSLKLLRTQCNGKKPSLYIIQNKTLSPILSLNTFRKKSFKPSLILPAFFQKVRNVFLPLNYPHSVSKEYWEFTKWTFLSNVAGAAVSVCSIQSMLFAVGLGSGSIPLAASLNWILKDGLGQLGGILYASAVNVDFDYDPKLHRFRAGIYLSAANVLEALTPLIPHLFLPIASASNILKNIAFLSFSATRAHIHREFSVGGSLARMKHQTSFSEEDVSKENNIGDITAKSGSQATFAGVLGTGMAVGLLASAIPAIEGYMEISSQQESLGSIFGSPVGFASFGILSFLSLLGAYKSNQVFVPLSFNQQRGELVFRNVLDQYFNKNQIMTIQDIGSLLSKPPIRRISFLTPNTVASCEKFLLKYKSSYNITLGKPHLFSKRDFMQKSLNPAYQPRHLVHQSMTSSYLIGMYPSEMSPVLLVAMIEEGFNSRDALKGFYHSCVVRTALSHLALPPSTVEIDHVIDLSFLFVEATFPRLLKGLKLAGWHVDSCFLSDCISTYKVEYVDKI